MFRRYDAGTWAMARASTSMWSATVGVPPAKRGVVDPAIPLSATWEAGNLGSWAHTFRWTLARATSIRFNAAGVNSSRARHTVALRVRVS